MTWVTVSDDDKPIIAEIEKQTDRGAALIATAYLEERLLEAIKARMNRFEEVENKLFKGLGPLASFSSKIDLGLLLGIYDLQSQKMLHIIRDIRNEFAHQPKPRDFNSRRIRDLCKNLFIKGNLKLKNKTTGQVITKFSINPDGTSRTLFLNAIKYFLLMLDMEMKQLPLRKPAEPVLLSKLSKKASS